MKNDVYEYLFVELTPLFGRPQELESGNGARCISPKKGKLTIYHSGIAAGNYVEIAFNIKSIAVRFGLNSQSASSMIRELMMLTGREVIINKQHEWPRVGFATIDQANKVLESIKIRLGINWTNRNVPSGETQPKRNEVSSSAYSRDDSVKSWVLNQSNGCCESCDLSAPFEREDGTPFLEIHHVKHLANGGSDKITNTIALCPNCHRRFHFSIDRTSFTERLYGKVPRLVKE
jgi:5-methylcytosine-specific restriction endonuclease McrA